MKRLFQINKPGGGIVKDSEGVPLYFSDKQVAKTYRNTLKSDIAGPQGYTVGVGPDHKGKMPKKSRGHIFRNRVHVVVKGA